MMLSNQDIIYFSNDWNADNRTSSHHIVRQLSRNNRVLYIESSGLRSPRASSHDMGRIVGKIKKFVNKIRLVQSNIYVHTPIYIPFIKFSIVQKLNKTILMYSIKRICKKIGFKNPILWIIIPHMSMVIGGLSEKLVVYYCVDDFAFLPGVESSVVSKFDNYVSKKANIIFTPSESLFLKKKKINSNSFLSPHGVDIEHFSKVFNENIAIPDKIKKLPKPIIGFFGLIEKWIDLELIKYISITKPEWSIVLIGRVVQDISIFNDIRNVYFLGARKYELLPNYAKLFDVAIIPYILNDQVMNANPIKLREYLAMGKPVVAVRTPEIEKLSDLVRISDNYQEFVVNIETAMRENSNEAIKERAEAMKSYSWENCFSKIAETIESFLNKNMKG